MGTGLRVQAEQQRRPSCPGQRAPCRSEPADTGPSLSVSQFRAQVYPTPPEPAARQPHQHRREKPWQQSVVEELRLFVADEVGRVGDEQDSGHQRRDARADQQPAKHVHAGTADYHGQPQQDVVGEGRVVECPDHRVQQETVGEQHVRVGEPVTTRVEHVGVVKVARLLDDCVRAPEDEVLIEEDIVVGAIRDRVHRGRGDQWPGCQQR